MKILFGIDGSTSGFAAVQQVAAWLDAGRDQVALYYSVPDIRFQAPPESAADMRERARKALAGAVFDEALAYVPEGLRGRVETKVGDQSPAHGLLTAADELAAELIVVGAHGTGTGHKVTLGSVARAVVHSAPVPVLVSRQSEHAPARAALQLLLAWDGSDSSRLAAEFLRDFTWPAGTVGKVVSVIEAMYAGELPSWVKERARSADAEAMGQVWAREHQHERNKKQAELIALSAKLPTPFIGQTPLVVEGQPSEQILKTAAAESTGLIVMGARGQGMWGRLLLGSTSDRVLAEAPCSVLVVRSRGG